MAILSFVDVFRKMRCDEGGTPVIGSSLVLSWLIVHDGVMRRSAEELSDTTMSGTSAIVWNSMTWDGGLDRFSSESAVS